MIIQSALAGSVRSLRLLIVAITAVCCVAFTADAQTTFTATAPDVPITINDNANASPYPSTINVSGMTGFINKVTVTLNGLTHTDTDELDIMLVNPTQTLAVCLMSDNGGNSVAGVNLIFDDNAALSVPGTIVSGTFKPTGTDTFPGATPTTPTIASLGGLIGTGANGTWRLYVRDDSGGDVGTITGWSITITTGGAWTSGTVTINDNAPATPYPSTVSVAGMNGTVSKVTVRLNNFSHTFPDDVGILLVGPTGVKVRLMTDVGGGGNLSNVSITFEDAAVNSMPDTGTTLASTAYKPSLGTVAGGGNVHPANFPVPAPTAPYSLTLSSFIGTLPDGTWSLYVDDDSGGDVGSLSWTLSLVTTAPTAAPASIEGRVITKSGNGISRANVTLQNVASGESWVTVTNPFGYYSFNDLPTGDLYMISVGHKRYFFQDPSRTIQLFEFTEIEFLGELLE